VISRGKEELRRRRRNLSIEVNHEFILNDEKIQK
jgi:hypothetical protein